MFISYNTLSVTKYGKKLYAYKEDMGRKKAKRIIKTMAKKEGKDENLIIRGGEKSFYVIAMLL